MRSTVAPVDHRGRPATRSMLRAAVGGALVILLALPVAAAPVVPPSPESEPLVRVPVSAIDPGELADFRGGFFGPNGLEISFGLRFEVDIDDQLRLITHFTPSKRDDFSPPKWSWSDLENGEFELVYKGKDAGSGPPAELRRTADGTVVGSGVSQITEIPGGQRYEFDNGLVADVLDKANGFELGTNSDLPVHLVQDGKSVELKIGDVATTLVQNQVSPGVVLARLANRRDDASVRHDMILDLNVLNYSDLAHASRAVAQARRVQHLVNRGVVQFGMRP